MQRRGAVLWLAGCNGPVNALSRSMRQALVDGVLQGNADPAVEAIVVYCEGATFFAGADLAELDRGLQAPGLLEFVAACEATPKPVIAALHGTVYGGGVVVAYACDHRIAAVGTRFAMPEVSLGLLPTFGGTVYLPRLLGVEAALQLVVDGDRWSSAQALAAGLIDHEVAPEHLLEQAALIARGGPGKRRVRDAQRHLEDATAAHAAFELRQHFLQLKAPGVEAGPRCLQVMRDGLQRCLQDALRHEHEAFLALLGSAQSRRLRRLFFAERSLRRGGFDRAAVEQRLHAAGRAGAPLLARALLAEHAAPSAEVLDALLVALFELPRHAPSLIGELLPEPA
jgi:3-hydroxyacyl-CoA dehydrogenase